MNRSLGSLALLAGASTLLLAGCASVSSEGSEPNSATPTHVIPFTLTDHHNIAVPARLNERENITLMLHTAVGSVSMTSEALADLQSVDFDSSARITSWGGSQTTRYSTANTLRIGQLSWDEIDITEDTHSGPGTDGKFGLNLFAGWIVEIDFERERIALYENLPPQAAEYERIELHVEDSNLFLPATIETGSGEFQNRFLLHSGFGGALLLDDAFARESRLEDELPTLGERELRDSLGNTLKTKKVNLPALRVGGARIENVPAEFFSGTIGQRRMSVFGAALLTRFTVLLDLEAADLYLKGS